MLSENIWLSLDSQPSRQSIICCDEPFVLLTKYGLINLSNMMARRKKSGSQMIEDILSLFSFWLTIKRNECNVRNTANNKAFQKVWVCLRFLLWQTRTFLLITFSLPCLTFFLLITVSVHILPFPLTLYFPALLFIVNFFIFFYVANCTATSIYNHHLSRNWIFIKSLMKCTYRTKCLWYKQNCATCVII